MTCADGFTTLFPVLSFYYLSNCRRGDGRKNSRLNVFLHLSHWPRSSSFRPSWIRFMTLTWPNDCINLKRFKRMQIPLQRNESTQFFGREKGRSGERRWTPLIGSRSLWAGQKCPLCAWIDDGWWQSPEVRSTTLEATAERPILPLGECHRYRLVISDHWRWLSASKKVETFGRHFLLWAFWL